MCTIGGRPTTTPTNNVLGLHVTASPHASDEFAPILFDSHYAFDASTMQAAFWPLVLAVCAYKEEAGGY